MIKGFSSITAKASVAMYIVQPAEDIREEARRRRRAINDIKTDYDARLHCCGSRNSRGGIITTPSDQILNFFRASWVLWMYICRPPVYHFLSSALVDIFCLIFIAMQPDLLANFHLSLLSFCLSVSLCSGHMGKSEGNNKGRITCGCVFMYMSRSKLINWTMSTR